MPDESKAAVAFGVHGAPRLTSVQIDTYNIEIKDGDGFIGDRASKRALREMLDAARKPLKKMDADPFGDVSSKDIPKKVLDEALSGENPDAAGLLLGVIEQFATELSVIIQRYLKTKAWKDTERIVIGGGVRESLLGEQAIGRAGVLLKGEGIKIDLQPIRNHPDEAGLIGAVHLAPSWVFRGHDSILAVDIGGTNMRAGVVELNLKKATDLSKAAVWESELWRHADDKPKRDEAIDELARMLRKLISMAEKKGLALAPFIGIGCPGMIEPDGSIDRGAQNLPGNWESSRFNLPASLVEAIPHIGEHETSIVMHNDAVVQGLSEVPFTRDLERWGVLTIGTGLGNARFTNRPSRPGGKNGKPKEKAKPEK
jgi:predicted NBD/HSP70 family sugar kinase